MKLAKTIFYVLAIAFLYAGFGVVLERVFGINQPFIYASIYFAFGALVGFVGSRG